MQLPKPFKISIQSNQYVQYGARLCERKVLLSAKNYMILRQIYGVLSV